MFSWRITKYNPIYRDLNGRYKNEEWTSFSDIGKSFSGKEFKINEYLRYEGLYVTSIFEFMKCLQISSLEVNDLEKLSDNTNLIKSNELFSQEMIDLYLRIRNNEILEAKDIGNIIRLILRESIWAKLTNDNMLFVHFGNDYYMYVGSSKICNETIELIKKTGLFVEAYESPYL